MPFYGQEAAVSAPPAQVGRPIRTFRYFDATGEFEHYVEAHFIEFKPGHVAFWREGPDPDFQGTLVLAEANTNVTELREVQK